MTCLVKVRTWDKVNLIEDRTLFMVLRTFKEKIHGMRLDVFMESLMLHKLYLIMILVNPLNQTAETLLERRKTDTEHLVCRQSERIFLTKTSKVLQTIR